jgi:hypothetical protein
MPSANLRTRTPIVLAVLATVASVVASAPAAVVKTIVLSGQSVPGEALGTTYGPVTAANLSSAGAIVFQSELQMGGESLRRTALSMDTNGERRLIAITGGEAPNLPGLAYYYLDGSFKISSNGLLAFKAGLAPTGAVVPLPPYTSGLFLVRDGQVSLAARALAPLPNLSDATMNQDFRIGNVNNSGDIGIVGSLKTNQYPFPSPTSAYVVTHSQSGYEIARGEMPAPVNGVPAVYDRVTAPLINDAGAVGFSASLRSSGPSQTGTGLFYAADGIHPISIARTGDSALTGGAAKLQLFSGSAFNNRGEYVYAASTTPDDGSSTSGFGLYLTDTSAGTTRLLAKKGDTAPGMPPGTEYQSIDGVQLNEAGELAFFAGLARPAYGLQATTAIFVGTPETIRPVLRGLDYITDDDGQVFRVRTLRYPTLNDLGQLAFTVEVSGPGVTGMNDQMLLTYDPSGGVHIVAREGMPFSLEDGTTGIVKNQNNGGISTFTLADDGTLLFQLNFTDRSSGLFTTAVPEPASLMLASATFAPLLRRRRAR